MGRTQIVAASSNPFNSSGSSEVLQRSTAASPFTSSGLGGPSMESNSFMYEGPEDGIRVFGKDPGSWSKNAQKKCVFTPGRHGFTINQANTIITSRDWGVTHTSNVGLMHNFIQKLGALQPSLFKIRGFCLFIGLLGIAGFTSKNAKLFSEAWAQSTLKGKIYGWNHFVDFLIETEGIEEYFDTEKGIRTMILEFLDWCMDEHELETAEVGREIEVEDKDAIKEEGAIEQWSEVTVNCPKTALLLVKSAVCHLFKLAFEVDTGNNTAIKLWTEWFKKQNKSVNRYQDVFHAGQLLDYLRGDFDRVEKLKEEAEEKKTPLNIYNEELLMRSVVLVAFFSILRPGEMLTMRIDGMIRQEDGLIVHVEVKTLKNQLTRVFIPKLADQRICPCYHVELILKINETLQERNPYLWRRQFGGARLSPYFFKKFMEETLRRADIDTETFTAYSYKHAVIKYLISQGVPEKDINEACRFKWKKNQSMISKYYAVTEAEKRIHKLLAQVTVG
jgi:hypothetical protein